MRTEDIETEVFLMPAASHVEKEGHFTNTQRLLQWRDKALDPPGDARSELHFVLPPRQAREGALRDLRGRARLADPQPRVGLRGARPARGATRRGGAARDQRLRRGRRAQPVRVHRAEERRLDRVRLLDLLGLLRRRRQPDAPARPRRPRERPGGIVSPEWGWAWPANRRILYNRASADPQGKPWSERKKLHLVGRGGGQAGRATTCPTSRSDKRPDYRAPDDAEGMDAISGDDPFIMMADGRAWLYSPSGLLDGPLPTHYEPLESPVENALYPELSANPAALTLGPARQPATPTRRPALPGGGHHLPADRAPHRRRHEPQPAVAGRAAARDVRGDRPGARAPSAGSRTAAG